MRPTPSRPRACRSGHEDCAHGAFSYLPDLTDDEIAAQVRYALLNDWPLSIEYTDDPHPRNIYWEMWGLPMFDLDEPDGVMARDQRTAGRPSPTTTSGCSPTTRGWDGRRRRCSFLVQRPAKEPGFLLDPGGGQGPPADVFGALVRDIGQRPRPDQQ